MEVTCPPDTLLCGASYFVTGDYFSPPCAKNRLGTRLFIVYRGRMPSLVGDSGQVLGVLGWALAIYHWCCNAVDKIFQWWLCVERSCELFSDIRRRGGASNVC